MGKIDGGILGGVNGKVGAVVGAKWNGIKYLRAYVSKIKNPKTEKQLRQRSKFSLIGKFVKAVIPVVRIGFRQFAGAGKSAYSRAMEYNIDTALKGEYPNFEIDFNKATLSVGELPIAKNVTVTSAAGNLNFTWDKSTPGAASENDRVLLLAYNNGRQRAAYDLSSFVRADGEGALPLPWIWEGEEVEVYMVFASINAYLVSDTVYMGKCTVVNG